MIKKRSCEEQFRIAAVLLKVHFQVEFKFDLLSENPARTEVAVTPVPDSIWFEWCWDGADAGRKER